MWTPEKSLKLMIKWPQNESEKIHKYHKGRGKRQANSFVISKVLNSYNDFFPNTWKAANSISGCFLIQHSCSNRFHMGGNNPCNVVKSNVVFESKTCQLTSSSERASNTNK